MTFVLKEIIFFFIKLMKYLIYCQIASVFREISSYVYVYVRARLCVCVVRVCGACVNEFVLVMTSKITDMIYGVIMT